MRPGTKVRLSDALKFILKANGAIDYVLEFGFCDCVVVGPVDHGNNVIGPELHVKWPGGFTDVYDPEFLVNQLQLSDKRRKLLLSEDTSKPNKLWGAIAWWYEGYYVDWQWQGVEKYSRLQFKFGEHDEWLTAKSHEEDVLPKMKFAVNKKSK
jgi:hypothetical protein